jgi:two-component system response regulator CpxR
MELGLKVLLVDDDEAFATGLANFLEKFNINTMIACRLQLAAKQLSRSNFDVVLLDIMLPGGNGLEFLSTIREISDVPVIVVSALGEESERVKGLDLGADDYVVKPFSARELVARLRAAHRRKCADEERLDPSLDELQLFPNRLMARVGSTDIELTAIESCILELLLNSRNRVLPRDFLYRRVFNRDASPEDRSLDVHVSNLRRKLGPHPTKGKRIRSIRGVGYMITT